jgi:hypothetical protein
MKFCLFVTVCVCLIFHSSVTMTNPKLEILGHGEYCIYSREDVVSPLISRKVQTGLGFMYFTDSKNAASLRALFNHIDGESITLSSNKSTQVILRKLNYHKVSSDNIGGLHIIYAYSRHAPDFIKNDNRRINLQIAEHNGTVTIGWPVILGTY